jgi:hypothetical protein
MSKTFEKVMQWLREIKEDIEEGFSDIPEDDDELDFND